MNPLLSPFSVAEVAKQHTYARHNEQRRQQRQQQLGYPEFDPCLTKPVHVSGTVPAPIGPAERVRLESELGCLRRDRDATQRAIDHLLNQLGLL